MEAIEDKFCTDDVYNLATKKTKSVETQTLEDLEDHFQTHHQNLALITTLFVIMIFKIEHQIEEVFFSSPC